MCFPFGLLCYQSILSWIYTNRITAVKFVLPITWTKSNPYWYNANIVGVLRVKLLTYYMQY